MTTHDPATVWRLHLLPDGIDPKRVVAFCHYRSVLGMGWSVKADPGENISWPEYVKRSKAKYGSLDPNVRRWKKEVKIGHLVWARTPPPRRYLLARVTGEWRYETADEFKAVGMDNIREVEFVFVGNESSVPGKIVNSFGLGALLRIKGVDNLSCYLWNKYCPPTSPKYRFDLLCLDRDEVISFIESHRDALHPAIAYDYMRWQTLRDQG